MTGLTKESDYALNEMLQAPAIASLPEYRPQLPDVGGIMVALAPYASDTTLSSMDKAMMELNKELSSTMPDVMVEDAARLLEQVQSNDYELLSHNSKAYYERIALNQIAQTLGIDHAGISEHSIASPESPVIGIEAIAKSLQVVDDSTACVRHLQSSGSVYEALKQIANNPYQFISNDSRDEHELTNQQHRGRS